MNSTLSHGNRPDRDRGRIPPWRTRISSYRKSSGSCPWCGSMLCSPSTRPPPRRDSRASVTSRGARTRGCQDSTPSNGFQESATYGRILWYYARDKGIGDARVMKLFLQADRKSSQALKHRLPPTIEI